MVNTICKICGKEFRTYPSRIKRGSSKYCSRKCYAISLKGKPSWNKGKKCPQLGGKNNPHWNGGICISREYVYVTSHNHPFSTKVGYVREHRLVMEKHIGRYLKPAEQVHHKGIKYPIDSSENKQDNRIENLMLLPNNSAHMKLHPRKRTRTGQFIKHHAGYQVESPVLPVI